MRVMLATSFGSLVSLGAEPSIAQSNTNITGLNFDLGTLSGVLGVILTIVFFIVGYRQSIGARKERAGAANRVILEILLRGLTLDTDFSTNYDGVDRFIAGKA